MVRVINLYTWQPISTHTIKLLVTFGTVFNEELEKTDEIIVTVIATGFDDEKTVERELPQRTQQTATATSFTSNYAKDESDSEMFPRPRRTRRREI